MPLVQAKCENCGALLNVRSDLKAANCPYCGAAYVVQDAINYFNSVTNIEHLHADVVNISDAKSTDSLLKAAEAFMKIGDLESAVWKFADVRDMTPQDHRGWWGLARCGMKRYELGNTPWQAQESIKDENPDFCMSTVKKVGRMLSDIPGSISEIRENYRKCLMFAPPAEKYEIEAAWNGFISFARKSFDKFGADFISDMKNFKHNKDTVQAKIDAVESRIKAQNDKISSMKKKHDDETKSFKNSHRPGPLDYYFYHDSDSSGWRSLLLLFGISLGLAIVIFLISFFGFHKEYGLASVVVILPLILIFGICSDVRYKRNQKAGTKQYEKDLSHASDVNKETGELNNLEKELRNLQYEMQRYNEAEAEALKVIERIGEIAKIF